MAETFDGACAVKETAVHHFDRSKVQVCRHVKIHLRLIKNIMNRLFLVRFSGIQALATHETMCGRLMFTCFYAAKKGQSRRVCRLKQLKR